MLERLTSVRGLLLAVIGASLIWWAFEPAKKIRLSKTEETRKETDPDFYMTDVDSIQYNLNGDPEYQLSSNEISHYPHNDITDITLPHIIMYQEDGSPWRLSALRGRILPGGDVVELWDEVQVKYEPLDDSPAQLTTESLRIFPDKEYAESDQAVMIETQQGTTTAIGLQADLKTNRMKLLKKVRGKYEPKISR